MGPAVWVGDALGVRAEREAGRGAGPSAHAVEAAGERAVWKLAGRAWEQAEGGEGEPGPCRPWGLLGPHERKGGRAGLLVLGWEKGEWAMGLFGLCAGLGLDMSFLFFFSSSISISNSNQTI